MYRVLSPGRSFSPSSVPHLNGVLTPGGGGTYLALVAKKATTVQMKTYPQRDHL